jgi:RNA polymerase sigma-70 factor (ECF subfamily)
MDETALVLRARSGDQQAFAELTTQYYRRMWQVAYNILGDRHDTEDAIQDTLVSAWQNLDQFRGEARFGTWIHRIAANCALMIARKRKAQTQLVDFNDPDRPIVLDDGPQVRFEDRVVDHAALRQALAGLSEDFREVLVLREFGDFSYADIAEHQNIGVATVKSRLNRARTQLQDALTKIAIA